MIRIVSLIGMLIVGSFSIFAALPAKSSETDLIQLKRKAEAGDPQAQFELGSRYRTGKDIEQDNLKAVEWYQKAADQKYPPAVTALGFLYFEGIGVEKDTNKAVSYYRQAAKSSDPQACMNLSVLHREGEVLPQSNKMAFEYMLKGALAGDAEMQRCVGYFYKIGFGVSPDLAQTADWYKLAARKGDAYAQAELGMMYSDGIVLDKDHKKAFELFTKSADQNNMFGHFNLGLALAAGLGCKKDMHESFEHLVAAAKLGHLASMYMVGRTIFHDREFKSKVIRIKECIDEDPIKVAERYIRRAARKKFIPAQTLLGSMYAEEMIESNRPYQKAIYWWERAAKAGAPQAMIHLATVYATGAPGVKRDMFKAMSYTQRLNGETGPPMVPAPPPKPVSPGFHHVDDIYPTPSVNQIMTDHYGSNWQYKQYHLQERMYGRK